MSSTFTTFLQLRKPEHRDLDTYDSWDQPVNNNMDLIDVAFGNRNVYTAKARNYILIEDSHSQSLNKLAEAMKDFADLYATIDYVNDLMNHGPKNLVLFPEYVGAVFTEAPGGLNLGDMTSDVDIVGDFIYNYYIWNSVLGTMQSYDISVQVKIPDGFLGWMTNALMVDICTEDTDILNCKVDVILSRDGHAGSTDISSIVSTVAGTWYSARAGTALITFPATDPILDACAAGDTLNIKIRTYSKGTGVPGSGKYVKVGAITIAYAG